MPTTGFRNIAQARAAGYSTRTTLDGVEEALRKLRALPKALEGNVRKDILTIAAQPLVNAAKSNVESSRRQRRVHKLYKNGKVVAVYHPGNLAKSIKVLRFRKSQDVFVGPRTAKKASGVYGKGRRADGYYGAMLEFGTRYFSARPFMRPAADSTRRQVQSKIIDGVERVVKNYIQKNKIR